ncbi:hypothetical protein [Algoriphagus sp.]|uniref:hypothetical protein n=1 Tax=Algoriphagus sp. TaxID=1872435 RepID=UPI0026011872|nr:hypothetical protein [Algoriphagus sp.]
MKKELNTLVILAFILVSFSGFAQKETMVGLWEVEKVSVGEENMTPVAKWFRLNADDTYQGGNGWLQSSKGNWNYDADANLYTATDSLDVMDEFGGFSVSFDNEKMVWEREEEGMSVKVTLLPIEKLPMSPADYLEGMWDLEKITENGQSIIGDFDKENKHKLFIRWDRIYINFNPEGKKLTGYWHINGHRPEITLLPHQEDGNPESWRIEVNNKELVMTGISDSNRAIERTYMRRNTF